MTIPKNGKPLKGWLAKCPDSVVPYIQLARLSPPAGWFLVYFPHIFGILHAMRLEEAPSTQAIRIAMISFVQSFFFSNSAHIWNDLIDADLDKLVARTRHRPIPRGAISKPTALVFSVTQLVGAVSTYPLLPPAIWWFSLPYWIGSAYYPFAKRQTYWPQVVLGFCLSWGIIMGEVSMDSKPWTVDLSASPYIHNIRGSTVALFLASVLWTVLYDTIYAQQDYEDDIKAGILSLAVLFRGQTKPLLWTILGLIAIALVTCGNLDQASPIFFTVAAGLPVGSLALMVYRVDLKSTESCWWWFRNGFWSAGGAIAAGLFCENMVIA